MSKDYTLPLQANDRYPRLKGHTLEGDLVSSLDWYRRMGKEAWGVRGKSICGVWLLRQ